MRRAGFNLLDRLQPWSASSHGLETFDCTHWIPFVSPDEALLERLAASFAERRLTIHVSALYGLRRQTLPSMRRWPAGPAGASWSIRAAEPWRTAHRDAPRSDDRSRDRLRAGSGAMPPQAEPIARPGIGVGFGVSMVSSSEAGKQPPGVERTVLAPGGAAAGTRARVVIVGAGFGGLACARKLNRTAVEVLLLDRRGHHLFSPLLYQVATALLNPSDIAYPLRTVFRKSPNVRVWQTTVSGVDLTRQVVHVCPGEEIPYDYLVLATGSADNYYGNEKLAEASIGLKSLEDATRLRNHVLACLERADREEDSDERRALLTFVVAGGGPTGVEYSGALCELLKLVAHRDFPAVRLEDTRIVLAEGQERLLSTFSERLGRYAERVLTKRGIEVRTKTLVRAADDRQVTLSDGTVIRTHTIVWTGGVRPLVPGTWPEPGRSRKGRVLVDEYLRVRGAQRAYLLGDAAGYGQDGEELPMLSAPAIQAGRYVAQAIHFHMMGGQPTRPFQYFDKGTMATIGRNAGIAHLRGGLELTGFLGWLAWLFVHVWYLVGFRNRLVAMASWAWNYVRFDRPIRIILETGRDPIVSTLDASDTDSQPPSQEGSA